jgi:hypothetical protein
MHVLIVFGLALLTGTTQRSSFNSYEVFLSPRTLPGACSGDDLKEFRNRTYTFRSDIYPSDNPLTLRDGEAVERNMFGTPEWETSLTGADRVTVDGREAVLLVIAADHVNGTGRAAHVMVARCRDGQLVVLFEASGEGLRDASFGKNHELTVRRWVWSSQDGHCCPSKEDEERYKWGRAGRFVRVSRAERTARQESAATRR